jgi:2-dehydropantoate 2-reductase
VAAARIAVLGAGSVGCFIGGCWEAAGLPVSFIGRPRVAEDIAKHGLTLSDYSGWNAHLAADAVDYATQPDRLSEAEIIALCVKSGATADAARQIVEHGADGALVISFQNGVSNVDVLKEVLGDRFRVARGMVRFNVAYVGDGRFHKGVAGQLYAEDRPKIRAIAERVSAVPASIQLSSDMLGLAWGKLIINLNNAVSALSGRTLIEELKQRGYRRVVAAAQREALGLLRRARIKPARVGPVPSRLMPLVMGSPDWLFNNVFLRGWHVDAKARSSMADDLAAGRKTEVDYINGELVRLADRLGANAPVNSNIVRLIRLAEAGAEPWPPDILRREVLGR